MPFDSVTLAFFVVFAGVVVWLGFQILRRGSFAGVMFGARSAGAVGRVEGRARGRRRITVTVHRLADGEPDRAVGIHMTGRTLASVERQAGSLSRDAALRLADLLDEAAGQGGCA